MHGEHNPLFPFRNTTGPVCVILALAVISLRGCNFQQPASEHATSNPKSPFQKTESSQLDVPNSSLSVPLDRWPNETDLESLNSLKGKGKRDVIQTLGHPKAVRQMDNGDEKWEYDWVAACNVTFRDEIVEFTFYTAGY